MRIFPLIESRPIRAALSVCMLLLAAISGCGTEQSHPKAAPDKHELDFQEGSIVLTIDGKEVKFRVPVMNYHHVKRGREEFPDAFEFEGEGISLVGNFWIGFDENWDQLVNEPLTILPKVDRPQEGESTINLPGYGILKVSDGSVVVEKLLAPKHPTILSGRLRLNLASKKGPKEIQGKFEVKVDGWY